MNLYYCKVSVYTHFNGIAPDKAGHYGQLAFFHGEVRVSSQVHRIEYVLKQ